MLVKTYLESMLDESGFGAASEKGRFSLDKGSEESLVPKPFWTSAFTSSALVGAGDKLIRRGALEFIDNNEDDYQ